MHARPRRPFPLPFASAAAAQLLGHQRFKRGDNRGLVGTHDIGPALEVVAAPREEWRERARPRVEGSTSSLLSERRAKQHKRRRTAGATPAPSSACSGSDFF